MSNGNQQKAKRFNFIGTVAGLKTGKMSDGQTWISFKLERPGDKKPITVGGFEGKADAFLETYAEGSEVKLFGYFRPRSFKPADSADTKKFRQFYLLGAYDPNENKAENGSEAAEGETAQTDDQPAEAEASTPAADAASDEAPEVDAASDQNAALIKKYNAMTAQDLAEIAGLEFGHDLDLSMEKSAMVDVMVRLENGEMVPEAA